MAGGRSQALHVGAQRGIQGQLQNLVDVIDPLEVVVEPDPQPFRARRVDVLGDEVAAGPRHPPRLHVHGGHGAERGVQQLAGDATLLYYMSEEAQEGRNAYVEKRRPDFSKFKRVP